MQPDRKGLAVLFLFYYYNELWYICQYCKIWLVYI